MLSLKSIKLKASLVRGLLAHQDGVNLQFHWFEMTDNIPFPLDGLPVPSQVAPLLMLVPIYTPGWRHASGAEVACMARATTYCQQLVLIPGYYYQKLHVQVVTTKISIQL